MPATRTSTLQAARPALRGCCSRSPCTASRSAVGTRSNRSVRAPSAHVAPACAGMPASQRRTPTRADLPSDRRPAGQHLRHPRDGAGGRLHLRHVRHRRRLPDDAAVDLPRRPPAVAVASVTGHIAASSMSGAVSYWRRRARRSGARLHAAGRRHPRHRRRRVAVHVAALARPARPHHRRSPTCCCWAPSAR